MVVHTFNPSTWEAGAGRSLSSSPAWSTEGVPGKPGLQRETVAQKSQTKPQTNKPKQTEYFQTTIASLICYEEVMCLEP